MHRDLASERDKFIVARYEVCVAIDFDEHTYGPGCVDVGLHRAFCCLAVGKLA